MSDTQEREKLFKEFFGGDDGDFVTRFESFQALMVQYNCAVREVRTKFEVLNEELSYRTSRNPIESISSRIKTPISIAGKLRRLGIEPTVEAISDHLNDVAGIRVICSFIDDIYLLADCLLAQDDITLVARKDYIKNPKENGYRSLHLIIEVPIFLLNEKKKVKVEVQLRTIAMEFWAKLEHRLRYKKHLNEDLLNHTAKELLECATISAKLDEKMQNIRNIIEKE